MGNNPDGEEAAQDAFVKAFEGKLEGQNLNLPEKVDPDKKE